MTRADAFALRARVKSEYAAAHGGGFINAHVYRHGEAGTLFEHYTVLVCKGEREKRYASAHEWDGGRKEWGI